MLAGTLHHEAVALVDGVVPLAKDRRALNFDLARCARPDLVAAFIDQPHRECVARDKLAAAAAPFGQQPIAAQQRTVSDQENFAIQIFA